jgi:predicted DNA-binding protein
MKKDDSITVRVTRETKAKLKAFAKADGRKLANYVSRVLDTHVEQKERRKRKKNSAPDRA